MTEEPNARHSRPLRGERSPGEAKPNRRGTRNPAGPPMAPDLADWLRENAPHMTGQEIAHEMGCCYQEARKRCHDIGVKWKERSAELQPNAAEGFEPARLPEGTSLDAPAGSAARIEKLRQRADAGVDLWDAKDESASLLPRCQAKFETPKQEPIL